MQMRIADGGAALKPLETALVTAPIELPCEPGGTGPLCDRATAVADVAKRFGADSGETVEGLNEMCNGGAAPVAGNTQHCDHPVREPGTIHLVAGHMHLLGRSIKVELNPGTPKARTILDVPQYDFDNQALQPLAKPIAVGAGDTAAGHLHPRRHAAQEAAAAQVAPVAVRRLGRGHERRDVPRRHDHGARRLLRPGFRSRPRPQRAGVFGGPEMAPNSRIRRLGPTKPQMWQRPVRRESGRLTVHPAGPFLSRIDIRG